jgi:hypothetical protein
MTFKSKLTTALAATLCALALSVGAAKADTITTFDLSGTFAGGAGGTLSGTITFNVTKLANPIANVPTTDVIPAADINYSGVLSVGPFTNSGLQEFCGCFGQLFLGDINTNQLSIIFPLPPPPNLYVGGPITDGFVNLCNVFGCATGIANELSGSLTPVPGPIAGAGLPGLILACGTLFGWRRRRKTVGVTRTTHGLRPWGLFLHLNVGSGVLRSRAHGPTGGKTC